jgi:hypothetical protein
VLLIEKIKSAWLIGKDVDFSRGPRTDPRNISPNAALVQPVVQGLIGIANVTATMHFLAAANGEYALTSWQANWWR